MALVFVPALAAVGLMVMSNVGDSPATLMFAMLAICLFAGLFQLAQRWENEAP